MDPNEIVRWVVLIGGVLGIGALVDRWWQNRLLNKPGRAGSKSDAETEHEIANARLINAQAESEAVKAVKEALNEVRALSTSKDLQIATLNSSIALVQDDVKRLQRQGHRIQVALAAHGQWDLLMLAELRQHRPEFPPPPPLGDFEIWADAERKRDGELPET